MTVAGIETVSVELVDGAVVEVELVQPGRGRQCLVFVHGVLVGSLEGSCAGTLAYVCRDLDPGHSRHVPVKAHAGRGEALRVLLGELDGHVVGRPVTVTGWGFLVEAFHWDDSGLDHWHYVALEAVPPGPPVTGAWRRLGGGAWWTARLGVPRVGGPLGWARPLGAGLYEVDAADGVGGLGTAQTLFDAACMLVAVAKVEVVS